LGRGLTVATPIFLSPIKVVRDLVVTSFIFRSRIGFGGFFGCGLTVATPIFLTRIGVGGSFGRGSTVGPPILLEISSVCCSSLSSRIGVGGSFGCGSTVGSPILREISSVSCCKRFSCLLPNFLEPFWIWDLRVRIV
jgi:hypothetical protein